MEVTIEKMIFLLAGLGGSRGALGGRSPLLSQRSSIWQQHLLAWAIALAILIILFFELVVIPFNEYSPKKDRLRIQLLGEHEPTLCSGNFRFINYRQQNVNPRWRRLCPNYGIVTVAQGGRLGNQMWEYASVWAVARRTGLEPFIPRCLHQYLSEIFSDLSVPGMGQIAHCPVHWHNAARAPEHWAHVNQSIVLPRFVILPEVVLTWVADIRREFVFRKRFADRAQAILRKAANGRDNVTFVGVHVRRTDYLAYLWRTRHVSPANATFYKKAMAYFRRQYQPIVFLIVSDEPNWCEKSLKAPDAIIISEKDTAAQDLATLAACNHSIIDYGTFGVWGAILAGGQTIVYNVSQHSSVRVADLLPSWQIVI